MESKIVIKDYIDKSLRNTIEALTLLQDESYLVQIEEIADKISKCMNKGNKLLLAGNGGSAADAQHIAGEFVSKFMFDRPGLPAIAITTDTSIMTAIGNDYGYEKLFQRQIQALGSTGDVFIALSTSGNSPNIISAINSAKEKGILTIGFTGGQGGQMKAICDICFVAPSFETPRIQETHITVGHIVCGIVEETIFGDLK